MKTRNLITLGTEKKGEEVIGYRRLDNYKIIPETSVEILKDVPSIGIVYNKGNPIIKAEYKSKKINALLLEKRINGEGINSFYTTSYCRIKSKIPFLF